MSKPNLHSASRRRLFEWFFALAVLLLAMLIRAGRPFWTGEVIFDERPIHLANTWLAIQSLRENGLPLWNPYIFSGIPLLPSHYAATLYPLLYPFYLLFEPYRAFSLVQEFHYLLAGMGTWVLLRWGWRVVQPAAITSALCFMLSGAMIAHEAHSPMIWSMAWAPWLLWMQDRLLRGKPFSGPLLAVLFALQFSAGYMQVTVMTLCVMGWEMLWVVVARRSWLCALKWMLAIIFGTGLMSVQWMSTMETLVMTTRMRLTFDVFAQFGFRLWQAPALFFPLIAGAENAWIEHWNTLVRHPYFGDGPATELTGAMPALTWLGVALLFFVARKNSLRRWPLARIRVWAWGGLAVLMLTFLFGDHSATVRALYHVPVLNLFRIQTRWLLFFNLATSLLAALGLHIALTNPRHSGIRRALIALGLILAASYPLLWLWFKLALKLQPTSFDSSWFFQEWLSPLNPAYLIPVVFAALALMGFWFLRSGVGVRRWIWPALWLLLMLQQSMLVSHTIIRYARPASEGTAPGNKMVAWLAGKHPEGFEGFRVLPLAGDNVRGDEETLVFGLPTLNRIRSVGGNWPLITHEYGDLLQMTNAAGTMDALALLRHPQLINMLGVRYLIVGRYLDMDHPLEVDPALPYPPLMREIETLGRYPVVHTTGEGTRILQNPGALPRAWAVSSIRPATVAESHDLLREDSGFDPRMTALVNPDTTLDPIIPLSPAEVEVIQTKTDRLTLKVKAHGGESFVVVSEMIYPGWRAKLDGQRINIHRVNRLLMGCLVPEGEHTLTLQYFPDGFRNGFMISILFGLITFAWIMIIARLEMGRYFRAQDKA